MYTLNELGKQELLKILRKICNYKVTSYLHAAQGHFFLRAENAANDYDFYFEIAGAQTLSGVPFIVTCDPKWFDFKEVL